MKDTKIIAVYPYSGNRELIDNAKEVFKNWDFTPQVKEIKRKNHKDDYIEVIKKNIDTIDILLVDADTQTRQELAKNKIKFDIIIPEKNALTEWMIRMYDENEDKEIIDDQINNWDTYLNEIEEEKNTYSRKLYLRRYETIRDIFS